MAKNSDKNAVLERRRVALQNAIKHESSREKLEKHVDALKQAVFGVAKKHNIRYHPFTKFEENVEWQMVVEFWKSLTREAVIAIVANWADCPAYKEILNACRDDENTQARTNKDVG